MELKIREIPFIYPTMEKSDYYSSTGGRELRVFVAARGSNNVEKSLKYILKSCIYRQQYFLMPSFTNLTFSHTFSQALQLKTSLSLFLCLCLSSSFSVPPSPPLSDPDPVIYTCADTLTHTDRENKLV